MTPTTRSRIEHVMYYHAAIIFGIGIFKAFGAEFKDMMQLCKIKPKTWTFVFPVISPDRYETYAPGKLFNDYEKRWDAEVIEIRLDTPLNNRAELDKFADFVYAKDKRTTDGSHLVTFTAAPKLERRRWTGETRKQTQADFYSVTITWTVT